MINQEELDVLVGQRIVSFVVNEKDDVVILEVENAEKVKSVYKFYHDQDCCECVRILDVDIEDYSKKTLINNKIVRAEYVSTENLSSSELLTYSFLRISGSEFFHACICFKGSSNGYYSTDISMEKIS